MPEETDMVGSVRIDGWPVVEVRYPPDVRVDELKVVAQAIDALLDRRERFALIHHATSPLDGASRRFWAEQMREQAERGRRFLKAEAVVTTSPLVRAALPAVNWLFPHPHPIQSFKDADEARRWCAKMLQAASPTAD